MSILAVILSLLLIVLCIGLVSVILMQNKRTAGMAGIGMGNAQTYWDKNKGRSKEGTLEFYSKLGGALMFALSIILCIIR